MRIDCGPWRDGPVVQWLERAAHNGYVAGSNPAGPTNQPPLAGQSSSSRPESPQMRDLLILGGARDRPIPMPWAAWVWNCTHCCCESRRNASAQQLRRAAAAPAPAVEQFAGKLAGSVRGPAAVDRQGRAGDRSAALGEHRNSGQRRQLGDRRRSACWAGSSAARRGSPARAAMPCDLAWSSICFSTSGVQT